MRKEYAMTGWRVGYAWDRKTYWGNALLIHKNLIIVGASIGQEGPWRPSPIRPVRNMCS
jgi:aspartate/methionine/tyrosine aminotransferase